VHDDDFFVEVPLGPASDPWDMPELKLRTDLLEEMRARPLPGEDDLACAIVLTRLVRAELETIGWPVDPDH
jgi:hypothetical protein